MNGTDLGATESRGAERLSLVHQAINGNDAMLSELLSALRSGLHDRVARRIPSEFRALISADDVVQDALTSVCQHLRTFQPSGPGSFERWVSAITTRRLRFSIRSLRARKRGGGRTTAGHRLVEESSVEFWQQLLCDSATPSRSLAVRESVDAIRNAIAGLPSHYQDAINLIHFEGRSVRQAAAILGRSERAIHGLCRRALAIIKEQLGAGV